MFVCVCVQDQAKAMDNFDERVKALQKRSLQVLPLKYRREPPQKLLPIEALCEFDTDEVCSVLLKADEKLWSVAAMTFMANI